jgi:phosphotriesterase-related protein
VDALAELFIADTEEGIDANDYSGPVVTRTERRAGVIKVAGSDGGPSERDRRVFEAAAIAHRRTGAPILTHCERGTGALEQARCLADLGVDLGHVALSHVDKVVDPGYHRDIAATGATLEYDGSFRWGDAPNGTLDLLETMAGDGLIGQVVLGMDAARRGYYAVYGGTPGLTWLLDGFSAAMEERGLGADVRRRLFVDNPARVFSFGSVEGGGAA